MCKYCTIEEDDWTTYEEQIDLGVLGKESYAIMSVEKKEIRFYLAVNNESFTQIMGVKVEYCPFCGRKL